MASLSKPPLKPLAKKAKKGFRGYPVGTIAFYGPDDKRATKVAVEIILGKDQPAAELRRWFSETVDVRNDPQVLAEIALFMTDFGVKSTVMVDKIFSCPHEEGTDYEGSTCPRCPFWANRDRYTGKLIG